MSGRRVLVEGLVAGALSYAFVAGFFLLLNVLAGSPPFHTALLLGDALHGGAPGPDEPLRSIVIANGTHLLISLLVGASAAFLVMEVEHHHALWNAVVLAFLGSFFMSIVVGGVLVAEMASAASWTQIAIANTGGAAIIGAYLAHQHRELVGTIREELRV
jgi:hypothetical protein